jgi:hypothetical protein
MADKKTGSARRQRDDDSSSKKKSSGQQKPVTKKVSSSRRAVDDDDDDDAPRARKSSARSGARDSARSSGGPPRKGPDGGKIFLYFVPGMILLLLGAGFYVANLPDSKPHEDVKINFDEQVDKARQLYQKAKADFQAGNGMEGAAGLPQLEKAKTQLEEANGIIQKVRDDMDALNEKAKNDPNVKVQEGQKSQVAGATSEGFAFDELSTSINQLLIMCRKAILERK